VIVIDNRTQLAHDQKNISTVQGQSGISEGAYKPTGFVILFCLLDPRGRESATMEFDMAQYAASQKTEKQNMGILGGFRKFCYIASRGVDAFLGKIG